MPSNHPILCHYLFLPRIFTNIGSFPMSWLFTSGVPKYWSFSISPSKEYSGLNSFSVDWFDLLAVQGTLKSLLQHQNWKCQFFGAQPSLQSISHICTWLLEKPQLWLYRPLSEKWYLFNMLSFNMLLFNMLSRFVTSFLPRSKQLVILWLKILSAVILEPKKIKSVTASTFFPSICHEVMEPNAMIYIFWMLSFKPAFHSPH